MTPYELTDLAQSVFSNGLASYGIFLSVVTAYLVAAYMAGAVLTQAQVTLLTVLFLLVTAILTWLVSAYAYWGTYYADLARLEAERSLMSPQPWIPAFLAIVSLITIVASLAFMWSVRNPKQTNI